MRGKLGFAQFVLARISRREILGCGRGRKLVAIAGQIPLLLREVSVLRVLVLSYWYEPDLSAGSFRVTALVKQLKAQLPADAVIDVVTTMPNRYHSFKQSAAAEECIENVNIWRITLPLHQNGMADQSRAFVRFAWQAQRIVKHRDYDVIYATTSKLFTGVLGARIANRKRVPLYLDIRDIFIDTLGGVLSNKVNFMAAPALKAFEGYAIRSASKVNLVSDGFTPYFAQRYGELPLDHYVNGIDEEFIGLTDAAENRQKLQVDPGKRVILYAGNIGEGQGLERIIPELAEQLGSTYEFVVIGDGGRRKALESRLEETGVPNVQLLPPVRRDELVDYYMESDILFVHLNSYDAFKKVLPSKIFEYGATGKPVLAGVDGFAATFVREHVSNSAVFTPCSVDQAVAGVKSLNLGTVDRADFIHRFRRTGIMREMAASIIQLGARTVQFPVGREEPASRKSPQNKAA
ncbi:MAG: glycosyltransferase involved in cell wall biosynthesis [Pirellulaceae bacterium]|jgi:glycosyltransferase involved in cell wall biosynthesis